MGDDVLWLGRCTRCDIEFAMSEAFLKDLADRPVDMNITRISVECPSCNAKVQVMPSIVRIRKRQSAALSTFFLLQILQLINLMMYANFGVSSQYLSFAISGMSGLCLGMWQVLRKRDTKPGI
jgi:hypothetical protein